MVHYAGNVEVEKCMVVTVDENEVIKLKEVISKATHDVQKLKSDLFEKEKFLSEKEAILKYLESFQSKSSAPKHIAEAVSIENNEIFDLDDLIVRTHASSTLLDNIRKVISKFGNQEYTVSHVEAALLKMGFIQSESDAKISLKPRIALNLANLVNANEILRTFEGKGNTPHRFKNIESKNEILENGEV